MSKGVHLKKTPHASLHFRNMTRILLAAVFTTVLYACGPSLQEVGIPTQGTVIMKSKIDRLKKDNYYFMVGYFTQPNKEKPAPKPKHDSPKTIDEIIDNIGNIQVEIGDYMQEQVTVSRSIYDSYDEGDHIELLYEKGNPGNVVVKLK